MLLMLLSCSQAAEPAPTPPTESAPAESAPQPPVVPSCPETTAELAAAYPERLDAADSRLSSGDLIVIRKGVRRVMFYREGARAEAACWSAGLGFAPTGHKLVEGDGKTPEGFYATSDKPWSQFYGAIAVHYPGEADAEAAVDDGRISAGTKKAIVASLSRGEKPKQTTAMGGEILLHGGGGQSDWTLGCIAMDNSDLDILRAALPRDMKTTVLILP